MRKVVFILLVLFVFGCDNNDNKPEKREYILHHRVLAYDIYLKLGGGEYTVRLLWRRSFSVINGAYYGIRGFRWKIHDGSMGNL